MSNRRRCSGIDISKAEFHVALLKSDKRSKYEHFTNDAEGFWHLSKWLDKQGIESVHAGLEVTSIYGHALALYLHQQEHRVSIVNLIRIKGYSKS